MSFILGDFNLHHPLWGFLVFSRASESFAEWLSESSFCLMNSTMPTYVVPNGGCSQIDLLLCSPDILTSSTIHVEEELYDSDHFPIIISVDLHTLLQPSLTLYKWLLISREMNASIQLISKMGYEAFHKLVLNAMQKHSVIYCRPAKCLPAWWTTRCGNLSQQQKFFMKKSLYLKYLKSLKYFI